MITPTEEQVLEFITESNAIENEFSKQAIQDSNQAWITGVLNFKEDFSIDLLCGMHRRIMKTLNPGIAGNIRKIPIYVGNRYQYRECLKPEFINSKLTKLIEAWNSQRMNLKEMPDSTKEAFIKQWHIDFESIHPFEDGNGRIGRMIMNLQRLSVGLRIMIIHSGEEQMKYYLWFRELKNGVKRTE